MGWNVNERVSRIFTCPGYLKVIFTILLYVSYFTLPFLASQASILSNKLYTVITYLGHDLDYVFSAQPCALKARMLRYMILTVRIKMLSP